MPLIKPNKGESQDDFIGRCMGHDIMNKEYPDQKQRLAICFSQWKNEKKEAIDIIEISCSKCGGDRFEPEGNHLKCIQCGTLRTKEATMENELRGALPKHKTDTSTAPWDGPANEAKLKLDQDETYYKQAYAWRDSDKDPKNKTSYKFIHHEVSAGGDPGVANIKGCQAGIAVLNGARGGADIPTSDKQGVWNHVASHLKDADVEPAPLRSAFGDKIEWRALNLESLEVRAEEGKPALIIGLAAPFGKLSEPIMGSFLEKIDSKAFDETLEDDIRCLFNHEPNYVLGRTMAGTLRLQKDKAGLKFENDPPDTQWAKDLQVSIRRGDVNQMSFAFECLEDAWDKSGEMPIRTLKKVRLQDISIVTYPAYPQTKVGMRALTEDELITVLDRYFQPKVEQSLQAPQVLTEGFDNLARLKRQLKIIFLRR